MRNKIVGAVVALCVVFGFATLSFAQEASFKRNLLKKIPPTLSSKSSPSLDSSGVAKSGQLPAYSNGPKPTITFTDINAGLTNIGCSNAAAWGDYDNDGYLDIVLMGWSSSPISKIYHNNGNGTFTDINAGLPAVEYGRAAWGDYNNDGYLDILMTGDPYNGLPLVSRIYRNNGNGTFTDINAGLQGVYDSSAAWGDYDNDGYLDILLTGFPFGGCISKVYHNNGNGTFTDINAGLPGVYASSVAWGDYDNDGYLDILLTGALNGGYTMISKVYHNNGNGTFTENINADLINVCESSVAWGDYDNDGYLDILLTGGTSSTQISKVYHNNGNGTFTDINAGLPGIRWGSVAWGDYDNDGRLDILLTGQDTVSTVISKIYHNTGGSANTVPAEPNNLVSSVIGHNVTLTWLKSTDSQTPQDGLSYNIFIGSAPNMVNKLSPMAQLNNGWRKVPAMGPIQTTAKTIYNLPNGFYYWGVQAIDTAFAGSSFTKIGTFIITNNAGDYIIAGRVLSPSGQGIPNVRIKQGNVILAVTDSNGFYGFSKSPSPAWSGTIKPFLSVMPVSSGYTVSPVSRSYVSLNTHKINQDFIITPVTVIHHHSSTQ